jgi:hypothetical protein
MNSGEREGKLNSTIYGTDDMKVLHGTEKVMEGGLQGRTDATDYFYFFVHPARRAHPQDY